jgi:hypothetical protein
MTPAFSDIQTPNPIFGTSIQGQISCAVDALMTSLPNPEHLSVEQQRGILTRYTAVLEGNFIYWMTGAYLAVKSEEARSIILENLHEEVRDCHPGMLRRFALAADAIPTDTDALAVQRDLTNVRLFIGRLQAVPIVAMMAFFEGFIQKFMPYLAELAARRGSLEREYTDVHGICDIAHSQELFRALASEMMLHAPNDETDILEGVNLLRALIQSIVQGPAPNSLRFEHSNGSGRTA